MNLKMGKEGVIPLLLPRDEDVLHE